MLTINQEAEDSRVDLSADDPEAVKLLVQFFYEAEYNPFFPPPPPLPLDGGEYWTPQTEPHWCKLKEGVDCIEGGRRDGRDVRSICEHHECGNYCELNCDGFVCEDCLAPPRESLSEQLLTHIKVYIIADKYNVVALKDLAIEKFRRMYFSAMFPQYDRTIMTNRTLGSCWAWWDGPDFPIAAQFAHRNAPAHDSRLREVIQETIFMRSQLLENPEIETLLTEWPGLAMRILKKTVQMKVPEVPKTDEISSSEIDF